MADRTVRATGIGSLAIGLWSSLALLTTYTGNVPPLQLTSMAFTCAFLTGLLVFLSRGKREVSPVRIPRVVWLIGVGGLFGYHALYFLALKNAPVVEANLINYMWPLLIVLFSSFLPGERLRWFHTTGALVGFFGVAVLITGGQDLEPEWRYAPGYLSALGCAVVWAAYSVLSRRYGKVPTHSVGAFCGLTAVLSWLAHFAFEHSVWPSGGQWVTIALIGIGPTGLAFLAWDHGVKHGSIKRLGVISFFTPLFSTLLLIIAGRATLTGLTAVSCVLIVSGAVLASGRWRRTGR